MASITGIHHMSLTVTDKARSVEWYCDLFGFAVDSEVEGETFRRTRLRHPDADIVLTLTRHDDGAADRFDETRAGLDHVSFRVPSVGDVEAFKRRCDERGVQASEVKHSDYLAMITVRDPDNIQLEVMTLRAAPSD